MATNDENTAQNYGDMGIIRELGELPPGAIVSEIALARIFDRHKVSVKRAIERGELPPSVRLFDTPIWTAGKLLQYLEARLDDAAQDAAKLQARIAKVSV